ncbi:MAG: hypothetical protein ABL874_02715, partial [Sphingopyxis sp.]
IGWCGTKWPWRWPGGSGGGGGGFDPDNPWPPNCPMCGGIVGAISAVVVNELLHGSVLATSGILATTVISLAAGKVGSDIVNTAMGMFRGKG